MEWWAALIPVVVIVVALVGVGMFVYWADKPRRDLIAEIKKRPRLTIHFEGFTHYVERGKTDG